MTSGRHIKCKKSKNGKHDIRAIETPFGYMTRILFICIKCKYHPESRCFWSHVLDELVVKP